MEQEYRISTFNKFFYGIGAAAIAGLGIFISIKTFSNGYIPGALFTLLIFFILSGLLLLYTFKRRVIISDSSIKVSGAFGGREFLNDNVKGFRIKDKAIFIYSVKEGIRRIMINDYFAIEKTNEFIKALNEYYANLDAVESNNALAEIMSDNELGYSENERNEKFTSAKKKALIFNICGGVLFLSVFFKSYDFAICVITFIYPLIGIFLILSSKGLIKFFTKKNSPLPSVYAGMYVPSMVLMLITIIDYHIINHADVLVPFLLISLVLVVVTSIKGIAKNSGTGQFIMLIIIALFYGYGSTLMINCGFDRSAPQIFNATVVDKYKTKDVPYVKISDWGNYKESGEIKILNSFYDQVQIGSTIKVNSKKGVLNIAWYYIHPITTPQVPAGSNNGNSPTPR